MKLKKTRIAVAGNARDARRALGNRKSRKQVRKAKRWDHNKAPKA